MARSSRQERKIPPQRLILDSGAVIAWSRGETRPRALLRRALELGMDIRIPVAVLAETLRGGPRDAPIHRVRNAVDVFPAGEGTGRLAGSLLGDTDGTNTVDALVAAEAILSEADVLTGDADDLRALLARHPRVGVIPL
jgi:predicted nucleic acid-binding protein